MRRPGAAKISPINSMFIQALTLTRLQRSAMVELMSQESKPRRWVRVRRVDECDTLDDLFTHCLPAFGGAYLRRVYQILDRAIGMGCPLTLSISGPVTVS